MAGEVLTSLIHKRIETHVQDTCKGSFDTSHISSLENVSSSSVYVVQGTTDRAKITSFTVYTFITGAYNTNLCNIKT